MTSHSEENNKKEVYSEPLLIKHGALLDITAASSGGGGPRSGGLPLAPQYPFDGPWPEPPAPRLPIINPDDPDDPNIPRDIPSASQPGRIGLSGDRGEVEKTTAETLIIPSISKTFRSTEFRLRERIKMALHSEENNKKEVYNEPLLIKHGALLDITAAFSGGGSTNPGITFPVSPNTDITIGGLPPSAVPPHPVNEGSPSGFGGGVSVNTKW